MKFLIVDDHQVVREGLAALLREFEPGSAVLQARDGAEALTLAEAEPALDAVMLDLSMPGLSGIAAIQTLRQRHPSLPVIVLSSSEDPDDVRRALAVGARGYVPKSAGAQTMLSALRLVLSGEVYVPPLMLAAGTATREEPQFTERQLEVLRQLCRGLSNKEIARTLDISEKTAKAHVTAIFKGLNVVNRLQAAAAAKKAGLVEE